MSADLIPRTSIDAIVGHRDRALELYRDAFDAIERAAQAVAAANREVLAACGDIRPAFVAEHAPEVKAFENAVQLPDRAQYERVARRVTDIQVWGALIERTDLDHLMDKQAKAELRKQLAYIPEQVDPHSGRLINAEELAKGIPEISADVVEATLRGFLEDAGTIFRRGIANAFSELDRRFRSHDGFKLGNRVVLSSAFEEWGHWSYYHHHRETLIDIERVFLILDGKGPRAAYAGIVGRIDHERGLSGSGPRQSEHEGDYFRVRIFKNGNAHLWFTRKDLLERVNRLLAEYYGAAVGEGLDIPPDPVAPAFSRAVGHARNFGLFPSPPPVVDQVLEAAGLIHSEGLRVLEPSAGTGAIAAAAADAQHRVDVCEIQPELAEQLRASGRYAAVWVRDFLRTPPRADYDRVVMNPPFDRGRDIDHVLHAWEFVKPGGVLVAVMSAGTEFRQDRKSQAFREWVDARHRCGWGRPWRDLPPGSFASVGTNVNAVFLTLTKEKPQG